MEGRLMAKLKKELMTSEEIKKRLMALDSDIKALTAKSESVKQSLIRFLSKRPVDEFTKTLYANEINFVPKTVTIQCDELTEKSKEQESLKQAYIDKLREEMIADFIIENAELKDKLKDVIVERTETGSHARVIIK
jgi:uncharacterized protein YnzC (UPF0291/DUF896 family)